MRSTRTASKGHANMQSNPAHSNHLKSNEQVCTYESTEQVVVSGIFRSLDHQSDQGDKSGDQVDHDDPFAVKLRPPQF